MLAKAKGVKTAEALWEAERKCPGIRFVPPHFDRYAKYSRLAKAIYAQYTDMVESFGLDECWLDVTGSTRLFGSGREIAEEIRRRVREELGLTVSVGVSFNKIFAKLGSDYKKPDAVTEFTRENFRALVWPLDAAQLSLRRPLDAGGAAQIRHADDRRRRARRPRASSKAVWEKRRTAQPFMQTAGTRRRSRTSARRSR